jgi:hypothetical protein
MEPEVSVVIPVCNEELNVEPLAPLFFYMSHGKRGAYIFPLLPVPDSGLKECFDPHAVLHRVGASASAGEEWWLAEAPAALECAARGTQERHEYGPDGRHAVAYAR